MKMSAWTTNAALQEPKFSTKGGAGPCTGYPTLGLNKETAYMNLRYGVSASVARRRGEY